MSEQAPKVVNPEADKTLLERHWKKFAIAAVVLSALVLSACSGNVEHTGDALGDPSHGLDDETLSKWPVDAQKAYAAEHAKVIALESKLKATDAAWEQKFNALNTKYDALAKQVEEFKHNVPTDRFADTRVVHAGYNNFGPQYANGFQRGEWSWMNRGGYYHPQPMSVMRPAPYWYGSGYGVNHHPYGFGGGYQSQYIPQYAFHNPYSRLPSYPFDYHGGQFVRIGGGYSSGGGYQSGNSYMSRGIQTMGVPMLYPGPDGRYGTGDFFRNLFSNLVQTTHFTYHGSHWIVGR